MAVDPPFNVYRDQLTSLYHGLALWNPNPPKTIYDHVSIGDVGYLREGVFIRMFNVILPWDHESNRALGEPEPYESLNCGPFSKILEVPLKTQEHYSRYVSAETNDSNMQAKVPDDAEGVTYKCRGHGALLLLPHGGHRADIIRTKAFEDYIRDHVVSWFSWAQKNQQGIERMEDLVLVSGCTLVSSWAAAAFVYNTMEAKISLARTTLSNGGECFVWGNIRGAVEYHDGNINPQNPSTTPDQCVFIRGFRAKRVLFWTKPMRAAAEPRPDDPDNRRDDEIQVTRVPDGPKYRDPLIAILDYIVERCPKDAKAEDTIAIAHDDDLRLIKDVEILTADVVEGFLREKQMPLLVENGAAILRDSPGARQEVTVERHESQLQKETCSPPSRQLAKAGGPLLANRQSQTPQFGSLLPSRTSQTTGERHRGQQETPPAHPTEPSLDNSAWEGDSAPTNSGEHPSIVSGSPRIQLPSISSIEDPFVNSYSRGAGSVVSLPATLSSSSTTTSSSTSSLFPTTPGPGSPLTTDHTLPRVQLPSLQLPYSEQPWGRTTGQTASSLTTYYTLPHVQLTSLQFSDSEPWCIGIATGQTASPLTTDYTLPRVQLPSLQFSDSEPLGTATGETASLPGIVRPNSPAEPIHSASGPLKYDDNLRHSSLSGSFTLPSTNQAPMYGNVARISDQTEHRASYTQSSTSEAAKEEWTFSTPDTLLASASANEPVNSPSRAPPAPPAPSSLVDRPQKKIGKIPKPTADFLKDWLHRHSDHPFPSEDEKKQLCAATGLSMSQVSNWMINARRRILVPMRRPSSGPATTHPLPSQRGHSGVSTGTLLRRASMPTDSLHLYHPLSLQSISHTGSGPLSADPNYTPTNQRNIPKNEYGGECSSTLRNYTEQSGGASAGYTLPTPTSMSSRHQPGYAMGNQDTPSDIPSQGSLSGSGSHVYHAQQQRPNFSDSHQDPGTSTPSTGSGPGYHPQ